MGTLWRSCGSDLASRLLGREGSVPAARHVSVEPAQLFRDQHASRASRRFCHVAAGTVATQAGLTVILSALAPFTAFWYVSGSGYEPAILFNGLMFAVASFSAQWMLRRSL